MSMNARPPHKSGGTNAEKSENKDLHQIDPETVVCVTRPWLNDAVYHETEIEDGTRVPKCSTFPPERGEYHEARVFIERGQGYLDLCGNCEVAVDGNPVSKKEFQERPCPLCGEGVKMLARHIPTCPERDSASAESDDQLVTDGGRTGIRVVCRDCDLDFIWFPDGYDQHQHEYLTDHEVAYESAGDRPIADGGVEMVDVCPECNDTRISPRFPASQHSSARTDERYRCKDCGHKFDEPDQRPREHGSYTNGPAKLLADADPDIELRPDGGVATHPYAPEDLGTATVEYGGSSYDQVGLRFTVPQPALRALEQPARVSIVREDGAWMIRPRVVEEAQYDYAVTSGTDCRISTRACEAMGLSVGDRVRHHPADDGVRLEPLSVEPDGGESADD